MKREWFQDHRKPHYDLKGRMAAKAEEYGAIRVTTMEMLNRLREKHGNHINR